MTDSDPSNLVTFFGRLHPLVVHLPIGFLVVLAVLEVVRWFKRFRGAAEARTVVLALLAISSIAAVVFGLMLAEEGGYNADLLFWHKWMGIGLAGGCLATALAFWSKSRWLYAMFLLVTLALLVPSTHFGGSMTHGSDYVIAHAPQWVRTLAGGKPTTRPLVVVNAGTNSSPTTQPVSADNAVVFTTVVQPVLAKYCVSCHSAEKTKGELRLDSFEAIMKGGESGHAVVAGKSKESLLVERIALPLDHDDHMPPDGKPQPTPEQVALLKWWVDAGAPADKTVEQLNPPAETANLIAAALGVAPTSQPVVSTEPAPLDSLSGEIAKLTTSLGIVIEPVAIEQPWLAINAAPAKTFGDAELAQLKPLALNVAVLNLAGTKVTDKGLANLLSMPNLQRLRLERTGVTDAGMAHLSKLNKLNYLNLYGTPITDAGLKPLEALPSLQQVYLWRTKVDADAAKAFAAAMTDQQKIDQMKAQIALLQSQIKSETVEVFQGVAAASQPATAPAPTVATSSPASAPAAATLVAVNTLCPVSGKAIDATKFVDFEGKRIAFCCDNCPKAFQADPAKFKDKLK